MVTFYSLTGCLSLSVETFLLKVEGAVYTIPFSFHIGLGFCLQDTVSPCTAMVSLYAFRIYCTLHSAPNKWEAGRIVNKVPY